MYNSTPLITVVIPVLNRADLVVRCLDSVAAQTLRPLDVVLVDNGSSDGTLERLEAWRDAVAADDFRVTVLSEPKPGACAARNRGLREVVTRYVMHFDSDDVMLPDHCEAVARELGRRGWPRIMCWPVECVMLDGSRRRTRALSGDPLFAHVFHAVLATQRFVAETALVVESGGWNELLGGWNDWELGVRLLAGCDSVAGADLGDTVIEYRQSSSITGNGFSDNPERWERALDAADEMLAERGMIRQRRWVEMRRVILAGCYRREGAVDHSRRLMREVCGRHRSVGRRWLYRLVCAYVSHGGRGVAEISKIVD